MSEPTRAFDRMRAGLPWAAPDPEIMALQAEATKAYCAVNATEGDSDPTERLKLLRGALGAFGESYLNPPVRWEFGRHIFIGDTCLINSDCTFLDGADIRIGDYTLIAPGCILTTASHPVIPEERIILDAETGAFRHAQCLNAPITIGSKCWLGAGTTVIGGVTIGDGTTVGAGSVVTRDLPPRVLAAGSPACVIRPLS
ncbi:MAG: sugar O-acetyltransferase [Pseudomonadota bacterium]